MVEVQHLVQVREDKICNTLAWLLGEEVLRNLQDILPNLAASLLKLIIAIKSRVIKCITTLLQAINISFHHSFNGGVHGKLRQANVATIH